ncbi:hypothetical protein V3C99_005316 [Haemonchus contortus]
MDLIVRETNRYGIRQNEEFQETSADEMRKFIGLCLQMGLVKMPNLRDYWSSRPCLGGQAGKIMRRTRFEELWKYLHLIVFRQYLPAKRHRYGIKTFKLCSKGEYTVRIKIYAGRDPSREEPLADKVAVELVEGFLDERRVLCTDNYYSSIGLAEKLISRRTHLVGTLRTNRKGIPKAIKDEKLKRGQTCYKQRQNGILVLKWSEKRDLHMIFTKHDAAIGSSQKPTVVENYRHLLLTSPTR